MKTNTASPFNEHYVLHELKHYLPAQAPLKDFIHHNTLHGFQNLKFNKAIYSASAIFGYRVSLSLAEYRAHYQTGRINHVILEKVIAQRKGVNQVSEWKDKLLTNQYHKDTPRIGSLRSNWKRHYRLDLDSQVHPLLFRILCSYLDQGISMWNFPVGDKGFLTAIREIEKGSFTSFFKTKRAKDLLFSAHCGIPSLLKIVVGQDETLYDQYIFDQQFSHQGWSGMVATVEQQPQTLLDHKKITLHDVIIFELLLEIDAIDSHFGEQWLPLDQVIKERPVELFAEVPTTELDEVTSMWQEAFEWSYYDEVLAGLKETKQEACIDKPSFQAMFCIDDRECSLRRYLEHQDPTCETFGTPGFFGVEFFFQPDHGKFYTKLCPAPVNPKFLIKEIGVRRKNERDAHFTKHSHSLFRGWMITQTLGFWSAFRLFINIFKPSMGPATASSFKHMDQFSKLTIENKKPEHRENDLQVGFTIEEMATRVEGLLRSIGLLTNFSSLVYVIGHGSSSVNNPHFAAYDCGACSGRAGSVNSRVVCHMANDPAVRALLKDKGIVIPDETQFIGGLHDTTRDEVMFFDVDLLTPRSKELHHKNEQVFLEALDLNAKERSRRFESIDSHRSAKSIHEKIRIRSVSLFEPRPELNHATNSLCIVGRRDLTRHLFLDRRSFLNSYDYTTDPDGKILLGIIRPLGPVCGGINLEYFFSRVDNQKLGAGTKLPHNVMGLFGVANGIDGDLRPGLPSQMIEVHDPVRLLLVVEHFPDVVLQVIQKQADTYEWFINDWVYLVAINPETRELSVFKEGEFVVYQPLKEHVEVATDLVSVLESHDENLPVYSIS
ncbi:MAG: hypothetical protein RI909_411 [Bacteroidota bacterium]|jgi:uncharacterized protein YbcC (UPF0753/DUF2309 family)